jgi:hypothetical protein
MVVAAKLTKLTHKIAIQLHLEAENCTICSSHTEVWWRASWKATSRKTKKVKVNQF